MTEAVQAAGNDDVWRELAGWYLLAADLRHVVAATRALQLLQRQSVKDPVAIRGLWISAHIAYARCFVDGPTAKLDRALFESLPGGHGSAHRFLLHTANKHLVQPPNPLLKVRVAVDHDSDGRAIGIRYTPSSDEPGAQDVAGLAWLAAEALKRVEAIEAPLVARLKNRL